MAAAITRLAALLHMSVLEFRTLKTPRVAYLLYIAWSRLKEKGRLKIEKESGTPSAMQTIISGILINILNRSF